MVERVLGKGFFSFLETTGAYGDNQFAYRKMRSYKDLLALNVMTWVWALHNKKKVGVYCSDVSGAFDRVERNRLLDKLHSKGLHGKVFELLASWLGDRTAHVIVEGAASTQTILRNMVFQGTTWGPPLWNCYYEDARKAVLQAGFTDSTFADDLNCYKIFDSTLQNDIVHEELEECQRQVHNWGAANRVMFDAAKESMHVLHRQEPMGDNFKILGVLFDTKLQMGAAVHEIVAKGAWKITTLLRSRRYHTMQEMMQLYKSHVLSYLESATPALYHASKTTLLPLDNLQRRFLREVGGVTPDAALCNFNLAPLNTRRDIAMLGVIHRAALRKGPKHFHEWFVPVPPAPTTLVTRRRTRAHRWQLHDLVDSNHTELLKRSVFGLIRIYNELEENVVNTRSVKDFQHNLQNKLKELAENNTESWELTYDPEHYRRPRQTQ